MSTERPADPIGVAATPCPQCGAAIPAGAAYCPSCGYRNAPEGSSPWKLVVAALVAFIAGLAVAFVIASVTDLSTKTVTSVASAKPVTNSTTSNSAQVTVRQPTTTVTAPPMTVSGPTTTVTVSDTTTTTATTTETTTTTNSGP